MYSVVSYLYISWYSLCVVVQFLNFFFIYLVAEREICWNSWQASRTEQVPSYYAWEWIWLGTHHWHLPCHGEKARAMEVLWFIILYHSGVDADSFQEGIDYYVYVTSNVISRCNCCHNCVVSVQNLKVFCGEQCLFWQPSLIKKRYATRIFNTTTSWAILCIRKYSMECLCITGKEEREDIKSGVAFVFKWIYVEICVQCVRRFNPFQPNICLVMLPIVCYTTLMRLVWRIWYQ